MPKSTTTTTETSSFNQPGPRFLIPIKGYLALMNIVVLCLLFPTISYFIYSQTTSFRDAQLERAVADRTIALEQRAAQLLRSLSHSGSQAIAGYNFTFLNNLIERAVNSDQELLACLFFSKQQETAAAGIGLPWLEMENGFAQYATTKERAPLADIGVGNDLLPVSFSQYPALYNQTVPLLLARTPVFMGGKVWGYAYAAFSLEKRNLDIEEYRLGWGMQMRQYRLVLLIVTAIFFGLGVLSALFFTRPLINSIQVLRDGFGQVARGDLNHRIRFSNFSCSEFESLGRSFNAMTDNLRKSRQQLAEYSRSLEEKVEERTRNLQEAQAELVNQAHEAGMAEMAVGVLHNIGNAITPAKVEARILAKQLYTSRLRTDLSRALEPLPGLISKGDLPDEEKQYLDNVINLLPASISQEYDKAIAGLENISSKHSYIENIISLQMRYAHLRGRTDIVDSYRVIQDSLKILEEQLQRNRVDIVTDLQTGLNIRIEESKLLQIVVNLVKNSCEAMAEIDSGKRTLQITSAEHRGELVIRVQDNGCGFDDTVKEKMFTFGYSTKARGSGFGLHSCANYLIANHGSITAFSKGPGKGAEFVIHLPVAKPDGGEKKNA